MRISVTSGFSGAVAALALCAAPREVWPQTVVVTQRVALSPPGEPAARSAFGGVFLRPRMGPGLEVQRSALGGWIGVLAGWENRRGLALGLSLGARYHAAADYGLTDVGLAGIFRVAALPAERFHPFGEIGPALHLSSVTASGATDRAIHFGVDAALGLTIDLSRSFALDLAGRGEIVVRGAGPVQVVLTPMVGLALRP
ncbi:MAG: hypothetical protein HY909_12955 [Deltaproteobacteria bacterium]|nr:hypothetical protein [Deltaproteobacteria bacterium]